MDYNKIYEEAFNDELEKVALMTPRTLSQAFIEKGVDNVRSGKIDDFRKMLVRGKRVSEVKTYRYNNAIKELPGVSKSAVWPSKDALSHLPSRVIDPLDRVRNTHGSNIGKRGAAIMRLERAGFFQ